MRVFGREEEIRGNYPYKFGGNLFYRGERKGEGKGAGGKREGTTEEQGTVIGER